MVRMEIVEFAKMEARSRPAINKLVKDLRTKESIYNENGKSLNY